MMDDKFVKETCKIGQGAECCRYLVCGSKGFECGKLSGLKYVISAQARTMIAQGDNCDGVE